MADTRIRVWDPLVRLFHWSLVATFTVAYFTGEEDSLVHIWSGYAVIGLVVFRIVWGFIGTRHARFGDFLYSPARTVQYLKSLVTRQPESYLGHTPAGGWMILLLLGAVLVTSLTGIKVYGLEGYGPLAAGGPAVTVVAVARADDEAYEREHEHEENGEGDEGGEGNAAEEFWEELHEFFANLTVLLIFVHVAGVIVTSAIHRENLVKAMLTGYKRGQQE